MLEHILEEPVGIFLIIIAVVLISPLLIERLRLPGIIGLIVGGIFIGPNVLGLLEIGPSIELLSTVGLIYLMFNAGLEIDQRQFSQVRNKAIVFGLLIFTIPLVPGIAVARIFGLDWLSSILMGSVLSSHTLVSFPILSRLGILRNEAVSVTIGATVFSDIGALLVLAIIAGSATRGASAAFVLQLLLLMVLYIVLILFGVPRLGKFFFRHYSGPSVEFQFVLVVLFIAALLAELIGMHAIVGAFIVGLAVNATLPEHSPVTGRVLFLGEALFVPIFLMYIGMVIDPLAVVTNQRTLLIGATLTVIVYAGKYAASWLMGRIFHYGKDEVMVMWGLSQAQAAATLATVLIGVEIGLLSDEFFNGAILTVLVTTLTSPLLVQRFGARLKVSREEPVDTSLFERILVPVANPTTQQHLIALASILASTVEGTLFPLRVTLKQDNQPLDLQGERQTLESDYLENGEEITIEPVHRVDSSISEGILNAALENRTTLIVMGWRGKATFRESIFGTILDEVIWKSTTPVLVGRLTMSINAMQRVVLVIPANSLVQALLPKTVEMASAIARSINVPLIILVARRYGPQLEEILANQKKKDHANEVVIERVEVENVVSRLESSDLALITTTGSPRFYRSSLGYIPERVAAQTKASLLLVHYPERLR